MCLFIFNLNLSNLILTILSSIMAAVGVKLFTWQFSTRKVASGSLAHLRRSSLVKDGMVLTIAGRNINNARTQFYAPENYLKTHDGIYFVADGTGRKYHNINAMVLMEEPTFTSDTGYISTK